MFEEEKCVAIITNSPLLRLYHDVERRFGNYILAGYVYFGYLGMRTRRGICEKLTTQGYVVYPPREKLNEIAKELGGSVQGFYIESKTGHPFEITVRKYAGKGKKVISDAVFVFSTMGKSRSQEEYTKAVIYYRPHGENVFKKLTTVENIKECAPISDGFHIETSNDETGEICSVTISIYPIVEFKEMDRRW